MSSNLAIKKAMLAYAKQHGIEAPPLNVTTLPGRIVWGQGARTLAWRVSGHMRKAHHKAVTQSASKTDALCRILFPETHVIRHDYHAVHKSGTRSLSAIWWIVLHDMEVTAYNTAAESVGSYFEQKSSGGSTNYGDDNNSIQQYLADSVIPWGAPNANTHGLHVEQMGKATWSRKEWLDKAAGTLDNTAWLLAKKSKQLGIPLTTLTDAQLKAGHKGVTTHRQCTRVFGGTHTDPGTGFPLDVVMAQARKYRRAM